MVFLHKKLPARLKHVVSNVAWVKALIVFADVHVFAVLFAHMDVFVFVSVLTGLLWAVKENCTDPLLYRPVKVYSGFGDCTLFFYSIFLFCLDFCFSVKFLPKVSVVARRLRPNGFVCCESMYYVCHLNTWHWCIYVPTDDTKSHKMTPGTTAVNTWNKL